MERFKWAMWVIFVEVEEWGERRYPVKMFWAEVEVVGEVKEEGAEMERERMRMVALSEVGSSRSMARVMM